MSLENEIEVFTERYGALDPQSLRLAREEFARYSNVPDRPIFKGEWMHYLLRTLCKEGDRVLELGSGDGLNMTLMLGAQDQHYRLCGAEITLEGCKVAYQRLDANELGGKGATLQVADGNRLPYRDGAFDVVVGFNILHHLDLEASLKEVRRVLRPGGTGIFTEPVILSQGLNRARKLIPYYPEEPTEDEHPLEPTDFALIDRLFTDVKVRHYEFTSRVHSFVKWRGFVRFLHRLDYGIQELLPFLRRFYSGSTIQFRRPEGEAEGAGSDADEAA